MQFLRAWRLRSVAAGRVQGRLLGGNLSLVSHLVGMPYLPDLTGAILFLEDVSEPVYSIDRLLTHLWLSGDLQKLAGIAFGKFTEQPLLSEYAQNRILQDVLAAWLLLRPHKKLCNYLSAGWFGTKSS